MEQINLSVPINTIIDVQIHIGDIPDAINALPIVQRWNFIAAILNGIENNLQDLNERQIGVIEDYLKKKLSLFKKDTVFKRDECIFRYCPHQDVCSDGCVCPINK